VAFFDAKQALIELDSMPILSPQAAWKVAVLRNAD